MNKNSIKRCRRRKPYGEIFLDAIIVILIIVFVMNIYSYFKKGNRQLLTFLGYKPVIVKTGSMEPEILINAYVLLKKCDIEELKINDIAAFFHKNKMIIHKVIGIEDEGVKTKGINNFTPDSFIVTKEMVFGKVIAYTNLTSMLVKLSIKTWLLGLLLIFSIVVFGKLFRKIIKQNLI